MKTAAITVLVFLLFFQLTVKTPSRYFDSTEMDTRYAQIDYQKQDEDYIPLMKQIIDAYYPLLANDFGVRPTKLKVVVYPNAEQMRSALGEKASATPMGAYYDRTIHILSPRCWGGTQEAEIKNHFLKEGPIIHELTHALVDIKTGGNYPLWLSEGLALYYEYKYTAFEWRADLKEEAQSISFKALSENFRGLDESLAYRKSFDMVYNAITHKGEAAFQNNLAKFH